MESKMFEIRAAISAFFAIAGTFLGWKGVLLLICVGVMVLDYISVGLAAHHNNECDSAWVLPGLFHKS